MKIRKDLLVVALAIFCLTATFAFYMNPIRTSVSQDSVTPRMFLKIDTIPGESTDESHPFEIEVMAFDWGENMSSAGSSGIAASTVKMRNFRFQALFSRASPLLFSACALGRMIRYATLVVQTTLPSTESSFDYIRWYFYDVIITSYDTHSGAFESRPVDEFAISFGRIGVAYYEIKPDGTVGGVIARGWDLRLNREWIPVPPST